MNFRNRFPEPSNNPLSPRALVELNLFSACLFVVAALFTQFLLTLITASLLKANSISFQYSLFAINFVSEISYSYYTLKDLSQASTKWSEEQIYFIFGTGPVVVSAIGLRVLYVLKKSIRSGWKTKLILTWMAFMMVNALPCSIFSGVFFYEGFGMAFHWLVTDYFTRGFIGLGLLLYLVMFSRFWRRLFLNACYSPAFTVDEYNQKTFITNAFLKPWLYGFLLLLLFNLPFTSLFWPVFLLSLGILPFANQILRYQTICIAKPGNTLFVTYRQVLLIIAALALLWLCGTITVNL